MKRKFKKSIGFIISVILAVFLSSCKNPFLAEVTQMYQVCFVTNCETIINSYRTDKIESIQKLTKENYEFDGWYTSETFEGIPITFPYEVKNDITFYAKWSEIHTVSFVTNCDITIDSYKTKKIDSKPTLTKDRYEFAGWYTNESFNGTPVAFPYEVKSDTTFYAKWNAIYTVTFVTNCDIKINSYETNKINSIQKLTKEGFDFDGWYISETFEGKPITLPYTITQETILYAKWIEKIYITPENYTQYNSNYSFSDGVLSIATETARVVLSGTFNDLTIKLNKANVKIIFNDFTLNSSKSSPLIESSYDFLIEYEGINKLSSSSSSTDSLIKTPGIIEFKGKKSNSSFELQPNSTTTTDCVIIRASKVTINGGNLTIKGSNGKDGTSYGSNGVNGSSGIKANVEIKNDADVKILAGNGGYGKSGIDYKGNKRETQEINGKPGYVGYAGGDGGNGGNGGTAIDGNLSVIAGSLTLQGGKGGDGANGGTGGDGGDGGYGPDMATAPGNGGDGGKGGNAGKGGDGGDAVNGTLENKNNCIINLTVGLCGKNGTPGEGGKGGEVGSRSFWGWTNITAQRHAGSPGQPGESAGTPKDGVEHR